MTKPDPLPLVQVPEKPTNAHLALLVLVAQNRLLSARKYQIILELKISTLQNQLWRILANLECKYYIIRIYIDKK
jgi:hypothetical protein